MPRQKPLKNEAIGTFEAAAVMGLHFTRPKRMADSGVISMRQIGSAGEAVFAVYSAKECDENFREYEENYESRKRSGEQGGRPRTMVHERQPAIDRLTDPKKPQIAFEDAISTNEAAEVLGVYPTRVARIANEGKIVGRVLWSERGGRSRLWIFSRASCEKHAAEIKKLEASGQKLGRPRNAAAKTKKKIAS